MKIIGIMAAWLGNLLFPAACKRLNLLSKAASEAYKCRLRGRVSSSLLKALIAGEDHRFYAHKGVDPIAIAGALCRLIKSGQLSGASTIEQQLVRVLTGDRRRTIRRKLREIVLACVLDTKYEKTELAGMYLAVAYFGWRMNGVEEACKRLCISLTAATARQAAGIVARLKYPEPCILNGQRSALIAQRTEHLLARMLAAEFAMPKEVSSDAAILDI